MVEPSESEKGGGEQYMTRRLQGHAKAGATQLRVSPELQALFTLLSRIVGENAFHKTVALDLLKTASALVACNFRSEDAALMLCVSPEVVRQRVHRIRERVLYGLRETGYNISPVRPDLENHLERWDPSTFDEHAELSQEAEVES